MTLLDRLQPALRSAWLPLALLLLALSTVFIFAGDRGYFYRPPGYHNLISAKPMTIAVNLSLEHGFQRFERRTIDDDGVTRYRPYNRFPPGGYLLMKLAALPVSDNPSARLYAARILMLLLFAGAAVLAYLSLCRLTSNRWIALTATLLAFSSYSLLYFNDMTSNEGMPDLFGVMLTFHGMVVFVQEGRFRQLLVKTCIALLLGWHVLALLGPFVIIGLASELLRARSTGASSTASIVLSGRHIASTLLRSRYLLLSAVALAFGLSILTFNFAMEYVAFKGETPLTELPSFQSMVKRTGGDSEFNVSAAAGVSWRPFLEGQFHNVLRMFIPYSLLGQIGHDGAADGSPTWLPKRLAVVLGVALTAVCLIGSIFVRPRILFATLASFGFFWTLPLRHSTYDHHHLESIYYIGLPLVCFTIILLLARRLTNRDGVIAAASVIAVLLFAVSSFQMSRVGHSAETALAARAAEHDMLVIRDATAGEPVIVLHKRTSNIHFFAWLGAINAVDYYLNTSPIDYAHLPAAEGRFVVMRDRVDIDALLTPQNQYFFLYDRDGLEAWYGAVYRTTVSTEPLAGKEFGAYFDDRTMYYLKEPCELGADTDARFFLHVYPIDENDLPDHRRQYGFDNLDFDFLERGLVFDGKCLARFVLPQYAVSKIVTGRFGEAWNAVHYLHPPKLILEYQSIVSNEPAVRAEFDLYLDEGKLYYFREPCERTDTAARFFLHVVPENLDDLPEARRQHGFDNLDFDFGGRGVVFDGKCAAAVSLPQYGIARIVTGQFDAGGRMWQVEFAPDARE